MLHFCLVGSILRIDESRKGREGIKLMTYTNLNYFVKGHIEKGSWVTFVFKKESTELEIYKCVYVSTFTEINAPLTEHSTRISIAY